MQQSQHDILQRLESALHRVPTEQPTAMMARPDKPGKRVTLDGESIRIYFPWDPATLARVKSLPGRRFHGAERPKYWSCPAEVKSLLQLRQWGFSVDESLVKKFWQLAEAQPHAIEEAVAPATRRVVRTVASPKSSVPLDVPGMLHPLLPFQGEGVARMEERNGRVLLADEQGLGKTIHVLAYLARHPELRPAVIVVPATAKWDWEAKCHDFLAQPDVEVLSGEQPYKPTGSILVINYDIIWAGPKDGDKWVDVLLALDPKYVAGDEIQFCANPKSKRGAALRQLVRGRPFTAISGTAADRPSELYPILQYVDRSIFPNYWTFMHRYCNATHNGFGWDFSGSKNLPELHQVLSETIMIRRLKKDVMKDLPDKIYSHVPIALSKSGRARYNEVLTTFKERFVKRIAEMKKRMRADGASAKEIRERVRASMRAEAVVELEGLKQAAALAKLDACVDWIRDFLDSGHKLITFATHKDVIREVVEAFPKLAVKIDGDVNGTERWDAVQRFQNDDSCRLFVGNFRAAGVNLTLTAAHNVAMLELPPRPKHLMQAEDRAHRIGQRFPVNVWYLLGRGTVEQQLAKQLDKQRAVVSRMIDGKDLDDDQLIGIDFDELIDQMEAA